MESIALKVQFSSMQYILAYVNSSVGSETDQEMKEPTNSVARLRGGFYLVEDNSNQMSVSMMTASMCVIFNCLY